APGAPATGRRPPGGIRARPPPASSPAWRGWPPHPAGTGCRSTARARGGAPAPPARPAGGDPPPPARTPPRGPAGGWGGGGGGGVGGGLGSGAVAHQEGRSHEERPEPEPERQTDPLVVNVHGFPLSSGLPAQLVRGDPLGSGARGTRAPVGITAAAPPRSRRR